MSRRVDERHRNLDVLVLASRPLGDHDRIVRLLAAGIGRIDAVARGAGRPRHRFQGRLEPFTRLRAAFYRRAGSELWTWREAEVAASPPLFTDWRKAIALQAAAELLLHSGPFEGMNEELYSLAALHPSLVENGRDPCAVVGAFAVRWSLLSGYGSPAQAMADPSAPAARSAATFFRRAATDPAEASARYVLSPTTARAVGAALREHVEHHLDRAWKGWRMLQESMARSPAAPRHG